MSDLPEKVEDVKNEMDSVEEYEAKMAQINANQLTTITEKLLNSELFNNSKKTVSSELVDIISKSDNLFEIASNQLQNVDLESMENKILFGQLFIDLIKAAKEQNETKLKAMDTITKFIPKQVKTQVGVANTLKVDDIVNKSNNSFSSEEFLSVITHFDENGMSMLKAMRTDDSELFEASKEEKVAPKVEEDVVEDEFDEADKYKDDDEFDFANFSRNVEIKDDGDEDYIEVIHSPKLEDF